MSDTTTGDEQQASEAAAAQRPQIQVNAQYVKDLSFENPNAPQSLISSAEAPQIEVTVDVGARGLGESRYEVELRVTAHAARGAERAFVVEVVYAGVFTLLNVTEDALQPICLIECPRILFPFARRIIADCTRDGGFPPLLLEPIDFAALYMSSQQGEAATGDGEAGSA
jgi:preprotein translocase subunit SecB